MSARRVLRWLVPWLIAAPLSAAAQDGGEGAAMLRAILEEEGIAGGVLLIDGPYGRLTVAEGVADRHTGAPMVPDTRFYIASAGKTMVAAAVLDAVGDGSIALDASFPTDTGTPDIAAVAAGASVRQLLSHTSGLPDYLGDSFIEASMAEPHRRWTPAGALAHIGDAPADVPRGAFGYSNTNYVLLGHLLARLDGTLAASLERRVFAPAGMRASTTGADAGRPGLARGYDEEGRDVSALGWNSTLGDGPVVTTAGDVLAFVTALFGDGRLLSPALRAAMLPDDDSPGFYGLGIGGGGDDLGDWYGHAGSYPGYDADFRHYPASGTMIVLLMNGNPAPGGEILDDIAAWYADG